MNRILYIGNNCHQCQAVIDYLDGAKVSYSAINIDEQKEQPPIPLFVYPALFENGVLVGYGIDIIAKLKG
jgi:hypothetical protein